MSKLSADMTSENTTTGRFLPQGRNISDALAHLREDQGLRVAAVQAEDEADGLEQLLDAGAKLVLLHAAGGPRVQDPRLDDKLEEVLQSLMVDEARRSEDRQNTDAGTDF